MPVSSLLRGGVTRWLAAGAMILVSGWFAVSQAQRGAELRDRAAATVLGGDPATLANRLFEGPHGLAIRLDDAQRAELTRQLAASPLNGTLVAIAALDREARGDAVAARALGQQALRVEPRTRLGWLARLDRQLRERRTLEATDSVLRLLAVDVQQFALYLPALASLARDRRTIAPIAAVLRSGPIWRTPFLDLLAHNGADPAVRYALMNGNDKIGAAGAGVDHAAFVGDLVNRGDVDRAYLAWLSFLPDRALRGVGTPYDATFAGLPGAAPFNWQLSMEEGDRATLTGGALELSYSGRRTVNMANQVVLLQPGGYRLSSTLASAGSGGPPGGGTALAWRVSCLPRYTRIAELVLDPSVTGRAQQSAAFTIPAENCAAVALTLVGTAAEFPVRLNLRVASVVLHAATVPAVIAGATRVRSSAIPSPRSSALP